MPNHIKPSHIEPWGHTADGEAVHRITLRGDIRASILTFGAIIQRVEAPDRTGAMANVVLGFDNLGDYMTRGGHFGAIAGRYAGRVGGGRFTLDGAEYHLPQNDGRNCLHGGPAGFHKRVWAIDAADEHSVSLSYISRDGEEGFPGTLATRLSYSVDGRTLRLRYEATTDRPTVLNLTNHSYFNLGGEGSGDVFGHEMLVLADRVLEVDADNIPTGALLPVAGTPFDFRSTHLVGERIRAAHPQLLLCLGYDQCFVLNGQGIRHAATAAHQPSGRRLGVYTDQPAVQIYTANKLNGGFAGASGRAYRSGDGLTFETQHFPDSPHHPAFPSTVLRPGEVFRSATDYAFSA